MKKFCCNLNLLSENVLKVPSTGNKWNFWSGMHCKELQSFRQIGTARLEGGNLFGKKTKIFATT